MNTGSFEQNSIDRRAAVTIALACCFVTVANLFASAPAFSPEENDFKTRGQLLLLHFVEQETQASFAGVAARYAAGERINEAHGMMKELLASPSPTPAYTFDLIATYLFGRQNLPSALAEKVTQTIAGNAPVRGRDEHEWVQYYAAILLAAETWPALRADQWFNGKSSEENLIEAKSYIDQWLQRLVTEGQSEYDSPQFMPAFFSSLALLHEFTRDEILRQKLKVALNLLMLDFACEHLDGIYAGAHSRTSIQQLMAPREAVSAGFAWLYFGAGKMVPSSALLFSSLSSFVLAEVILQLAVNRDPLGGYVHLERKRPFRFNRYGKNSSTAVLKYAYITRSYVLGSIQGGAFYPDDQHSWGLTYISPQDRTPSLFIINPTLTEQELALSHTEEPRVKYAESVGSDFAGNEFARLPRASAYERLLQHRNVLIAMYDTPDSASMVNLHGFLSEKLNLTQTAEGEEMNSAPDWIFCQAESTFIAIMPFFPFQIEKISGGELFTSKGAPNGYVLELSTPQESASFEIFRQRIQNVSKIDLSRLASQKRVKYTTIYGDKLELAYDAKTGLEERKLNDVPIKANEYPLFASPFVKHFPNESRLVVRVNNRWLELDFRKWEITERVSTITEQLKNEWD